MKKECGKFKRGLIIAGLYILIYIICTLIFIGLFHTGLLSGLDVLMYKGIAFILITGVIAGILMFLAMKFIKFLKLNGKDVLLMFCIFCCVNMVLFTLIPVTVERSVSVFMLSYMYENDGEAFTEEEMSDTFKDIYVDDFGAFEKRFHEQVVSGNIEDKGDGYTLTDSGRTVVKLFRTVSKWFNTDQRVVYPSEFINK